MSAPSTFATPRRKRAFPEESYTAILHIQPLSTGQREGEEGGEGAGGGRQTVQLTVHGDFIRSLNAELEPGTTNHKENANLQGKRRYRGLYNVTAASALVTPDGGLQRPHILQGEDEDDDDDDDDDGGNHEIGETSSIEDDISQGEQEEETEEGQSRELIKYDGMGIDRLWYGQWANNNTGDITGQRGIEGYNKENRLIVFHVMPEKNEYSDSLPPFSTISTHYPASLPRFTTWRTEHAGFSSPESGGGSSSLVWQPPRPDWEWSISTVTATSASAEAEASDVEEYDDDEEDEEDDVDDDDGVGGFLAYDGEGRRGGGRRVHFTETRTAGGVHIDMIDHATLTTTKAGLEQGDASQGPDGVDDSVAVAVTIIIVASGFAVTVFWLMRELFGIEENLFLELSYLCILISTLIVNLQ
ncbi:hypothetical protein EKO27_g9258 [Xylaria grammica]|uniref:Uncharacterized protein n=1 Tax=Xylaria grammica TaxID=363999 RepID=A0A439CUN9_9PEZI|nr:hypothetical protein EKO27_g9258 [Xylaria grammica]